MDQPFQVISVSGDVDATWSDSHATDSDDNHPSSDVLSRSTSWVRAASISISCSSLEFDDSAASHISHMSASQLSPVTTGIDIPGAAAVADAYPPTASSSLSSAPTLDNSTTLSSPTLENSTSPASNSGPHDACADEHDRVHGHLGESTRHDRPRDNDILHNHVGAVDEMQWEVDICEELAVPKIEPVDEDNFCLDDLEEAPPSLEPAATAVPEPGAKVKRPRGRPRKLSIVTPAPATTGKVAKGRSKTGCITCRKRKKKCDEAKPRCTFRKLVSPPMLVFACARPS